LPSWPKRHSVSRRARPHAPRGRTVSADTIATFAKASSLIFAYFIGSLRRYLLLSLRDFFRYTRDFRRTQTGESHVPSAGGRQDTPEHGERDWE
jgi:hypothetical protein